MTTYRYNTHDPAKAHLGLVVLQADETLEDELRSVMPSSISLLVSRVRSDTQVTLESLSAMEAHLAHAADLFPANKRFDVMGYGCTSGTAQIGPHKIAECLRAARPAQKITEPLSALRAACQNGSIKNLALLSPYIESVSQTLRDALQQSGVATPVFGSFGEANEASVARIDENSVIEAARALVANQTVDALFLSCTNLRSFNVIPKLQKQLGIPVFSSNLILAWHMLQLAGAISKDASPASLLDNRPGNFVLSTKGGSV